MTDELNQRLLKPQSRRTYHAIPPLYIEDIPEVNQDRNTNGSDSEDAVNLGSPRACHKCACCEQPSPPLDRKFPENDSQSYIQI